MTDDAERLARLVSELGADSRHAVGSRRFPGVVTDDDAVAIASELAEEFDAGVKQRAELAERANLHIYCKSGCTTCCCVMVMVYRPEALVIARWLLLPENAGAREAFLRAYPVWREAAGEAPEQLTKLFVGGDGKNYDTRHQDYFRKRLLCAFNQEGRCSIYPVRPIGCRNAHALDTDAYCCADPPEGKRAAAVEFVPLDRFLKSATSLLSVWTAMAPITSLPPKSVVTFPSTPNVGSSMPGVLACAAVFSW